MLRTVAGEQETSVMDTEGGKNFKNYESVNRMVSKTAERFTGMETKTRIWQSGGP